jgi:phosphoribosyl-ATP pyrophosphohydrolase/phosphoribosyl-AMP cyclohydrolase/histidinol dehydrogenase
MSPFLSLLDDEDSALVDSLSRIGPIIIPARKKPSLILPKHSEWYIFVDQFASVDVSGAIAWLDGGADKIVVPISWAEALVGVIPAARLFLFLDVSLLTPVSDVVRSGVSGVIFETCSLDLEVISTLSKPFSGCSIYVFIQDSSPSSSTIRQLHRLGFNAVLSASQLTLSSTSSSKIHIADAFLASLSSDRPDGLFPTVIVSQTGHALGLVYSSRESVNESIVTGRGVYQSRKHGLWRKGETSGATQEVLRVRQDCDSDSLEFTVIQHGAGFCHLELPSCFGKSSGLFALENTLRSRLESAPVGSYTRRLFNDPKLLRAKIMEEAQELCEAESKGDIAFEAADLFYFALTKCVAAGVGIADIEWSLDQKAKKITRRPGNAKLVSDSEPKPVNPPTSSASQTIDDSARIRMRTFELTYLSPRERSQLLRRPVLKSEELFSKIKPIISDVRTRGDAALLEFTAKFDKAKLTSTVIVSPFGEDLMRVDRPVREAIDKAYANIHKFHEAQVDLQPLVVETIPGVVCSRFARPIARVGLYVPGGTAVLPSTALMLGIPAQVAGCKRIVFATPPRPDGSISPEVVYVASLVGASAILKAGGAQAIAALAYGTESVPKVDKIFGPGNQWVTAAKMLVQNDTEALVSIDMPAGPSEVLVSLSLLR